MKRLRGAHGVLPQAGMCTIFAVALESRIAKDTLQEAFQKMNHVIASARDAIFGTTLPVEASSFEDAIAIHGKQTGLLSTSTFSMKV